MQILIYLATLLAITSAGDYEKQSSSSNEKTIRIIKEEHQAPQEKIIKIIREHPPEIRTFKYLQKRPAPPPLIKTLNIVHQPPPLPPTVHQYAIINQRPPPPPELHSYKIVKHHPPPPAIVNTVSVVRQPSAVVVAKAIPFVKEHVVHHGTSIVPAPAPPSNPWWQGWQD